MWGFIVSWCFLKIRNSSLKIIRLCQSHYLSAPILSWDAMLNMENVDLELIWDAYMHLLFEMGVRGGVLYTSKRSRKVKNNYLQSYYPKQ